ncbi:MAG: efflux RND transporter periplasmic adaptor subunit [Bacteroidota bacterium]|nr:efflux RND transporter periplasmic adaptor subunit [Bacteroidota bacterium]MDP4230150.1 efflux RND transporter periplasmic adaptor subunit [Bacteroidota bacterium]
MIENTSKKKSYKFIIWGVIALVIVIGAYLYMTISKGHATHEDATMRSKEAAAGVRVRVASVTPSASEYVLTIPGEVRPYTSVTLYAKISGYLKKINVDKGDNVRQGQIVATIESPELDKTYLAAQVTAKNLRSIAKRNQDLLKQGLVSPQDAEQAASNADAAEETVASLAQQRAYETVTSPFAGKVTARFVDAGTLVQSTTNSVPLVTISEVNRLRIYIYLDQKDASFIKEGDSVQIRLLERPGLNIPATITRYTGEIDQHSRTLLAEIDLDNKNNLILPGSFTQVSIKVKARPYLQMPSEALIVKGKDYFAAVVDSAGILRYRKIEIADNDGKVIQIASGLNAGDRIALGIGDALTDGDKVQVIAPPPLPVK